MIVYVYCLYMCVIWSRGEGSTGHLAYTPLRKIMKFWEGEIIVVQQKC